MITLIHDDRLRMWIDGNDQIYRQYHGAEAEKIVGLGKRAIEFLYAEDIKRAKKKTAPAATGTVSRH